MKIESLQMYNHFGCHVPCNCPQVEFDSLFQIACFMRNWLAKSQLAEAFVWVDNQRYMLVTLNNYDIHYHGFFQTPLNK